MVLRRSRGDADEREDFGKVVTDETVTAPLCEETDADGDKDSMTVGFSGEKLFLWLFCCFLFFAECFSDLIELGGYKGGRLVTFGVVFDQSYVPRVTPAARIAPANQVPWKKPTMVDRYLG